MPLFPLLAVCLFCWLSCAAMAATTASPAPAATPQVVRAAMAVPAVNPPVIRVAAVVPPPAGPSTAIWSGVVLATNQAHPSQAPPHLRSMADKLRHIFGYNQFQLVGEYAEKVGSGAERWLMPTRDFFLKAHKNPGRNSSTRIVLFEGRRRVAEFDADLESGRPLFIRGPQYQGGQLLIVLRAVDPSQVPPHAPMAPFFVTPPPALNLQPPKIRQNSGVVVVSAKLPKQRPAGPLPRIIPNQPQHLTPLPTDHIGIVPDNHIGGLPGNRPAPNPPGWIGPIPADHFSPLPGEGGPGGHEGKLGRP
jgi:hypothetical protein